LQSEAKHTGKEKSVVAPQVATAKTNHVGIVPYSEPDVTYCNLIGANLAFPIPELRFPHPVTDIGLGEGKIHSNSNILSFADNLPVKASSVSTVQSDDDLHNVCESSSTEFEADKVEISLWTSAQDDLLESDGSSNTVMTDVESKSHTIHVCLSEWKYRDISFRELNEPITCLVDNGAQISVIKEELIGDLDLPAISRTEV